MPSVTPSVQVNWNGDGTTLVDETTRVRTAVPITAERGRDQAREYAPPIAGRAAWTFDNQTGRFSFMNVLSPLAGFVVPGRLAIVSAVSNATTYKLSTGYLDIPTERPLIGNQDVQFTMLDGLARLKATTITTAMYTSIRTDQAIGYVLDAAGWSGTLRILDTGATTLARWWVDGVDAFTALRDLVLTEGPGSLFYVDKDGYLNFESRHYRLLTTRCTTSQATFSSQTNEPIFSRLDVEPGMRGIVNSMTIPVRSYTVAALAPIWTGTVPFALVNNEVRTLTISTTADGFTGALVPVVTTDYTLSAGAITPTLSRTSGKAATLTLTAGPSGATVTFLQVRAQTVTITTTAVANSLNTATSIAAYGLKTYPSDLIPIWVPDVNEATTHADAAVGRYKDPVPQVRLVLNNGVQSRITQAFTRQISDRVTLVEPARAFINDDFSIEAIGHQITGGGNLETIFSTERASNGAFWVLGIPGFSELGTTTRLAF